MKAIPIQKQFGADIGSMSGKDLFHKTVTSSDYNALPKSIADDFNVMFAKLEFSNAKAIDPVLIARLQGYLLELSFGIGLMSAVLQETGFQIKRNYTFDGPKLSIERRGV